MKFPDFLETHIVPLYDTSAHAYEAVVRFYDVGNHQQLDNMWQQQQPFSAWTDTDARFNGFDPCTCASKSHAEKGKAVGIRKSVFQNFMINTAQEEDWEGVHFTSVPQFTASTKCRYHSISACISNFTAESFEAGIVDWKATKKIVRHRCDMGMDHSVGGEPAQRTCTYPWHCDLAPQEVNVQDIPIFAMIRAAEAPTPARSALDLYSRALPGRRSIGFPGRNNW